MFGRASESTPVGLNVASGVGNGEPPRDEARAEAAEEEHAPMVLPTGAAKKFPPLLGVVEPN